MLLYLIIGIIVAYAYLEPAGLTLQRYERSAPALAAALPLFSWLTAGLCGYWILRRLAVSPIASCGSQRQYAWWQIAHAALLLVAYCGLVHMLHWPAVVRAGWGLAGWVLVDDLLVLAPVLLAGLIGWSVHLRVTHFLQHPADLVWAGRWGGPSLGSRLNFLWRFHLGVVLVPFCLLVGADDLATLLLPEFSYSSELQFCISIVALGAILVLSPVLLRLLWGARALEPGPVRERLERLARRTRFRFSDILVWPSHGVVVNAAVAGILRWPRYVLLSDSILESLEPEEIEAVFGHEIGHIRYRHLPYYLMFFAACGLSLSVALLSWRFQFGGFSFDWSLVRFAESVLLPVGWAVLCLGFAFGFVSRRFERQADLFGCLAVSCGSEHCPPHEPGDEELPERPCATGVRSLARALQRISELTGRKPELGTWRHFSVAGRVEFLERVLADPSIVHRAMRVANLLKLAILALLAASAFAAWLALRSVGLG